MQHGTFSTSFAGKYYYRQSASGGSRAKKAPKKRPLEKDSPKNLPSRMDINHAKVAPKKIGGGAVVAILQKVRPRGPSRRFMQGE
jgi:hypothetical protein